MTVSSVNPSMTQALQRAPRPDEATAPRQAEARPKASETEAKPAEKPAPVVNTQGQVTGRLLNVSA